MRSIGLTAILVVTVGLVSATNAVAQTQTPAAKKATVAPAARPEPNGAPPELVIALSKGGNKIEIRRVVTRTVSWVSEFKTATGETVAQTEMRPLPETQSSVVELSTFAVRRVDGKPVPKKNLTDRLAKATPILVMDPGTKYDDRFLTLCKPDTLIFVEKTARRISPNASPEVAPVSTTSQVTPTAAAPEVTPPVVPSTPTAKPANAAPARKASTAPLNPARKNR